MWRLRGIAVATLLVLGNIGAGVAIAQAVDQAGGSRQQDAPWGADLARPTALLSRLHHAAVREVELGELAEVGGAHRDTRLYGAEVTADFRAFDQRVIAFAAQNGIDQAKLDQTFPGENVVALRRQVADLGRLANERGDKFDRDFWIAIAEEQSATSDLLPSTLAYEPGLATMVNDLGQLLDRSSRRALGAARATEPPASTTTTVTPPASPSAR